MPVQFRLVPSKVLVTKALKRATFTFAEVGAMHKGDRPFIVQKKNLVFVRADNGEWVYEILGTNWAHETFQCRLVERRGPRDGWGASAETED